MGLKKPLPTKKIPSKIKMKENHRIKQAIIDFVKGGDTSDVELLDKVLHKDFRVTNNGFMGTSGITIVTKNEYLNKIKSGVFGGLPRQLEILEIDQSGKIASVKLRIESAENDFISYNSFVLDADKEWKLINNLAVVKSKKNELK
ncbi:hypothetical protein GCM10007383_27950 [Arenibacter certesii]|uniref:Nuclear transport factor 2 family protein n=2 Tax=Arenibacter certesii TaxID=228955 RepID=A0A918MP23_9FLAO|nr:hypothetical protein GCM10007383_27950 [Arenibacter certesii]